MELSKSPKGLSFIDLGAQQVGKLYKTNIFIKANGKVVLNSGGWLTMHTKKCINLICADLGLEIYVQQKAGKWFVHYKSDGHECTKPFADHIELPIA